MINFLIGIFLASLIISLFSTRLYKLLFWYALNSLSLGFLAIYFGANLDDNGMIIAGVITVLMKSIGIPYFLKQITVKLQLVRQVQPNIKIQHSILLVPAILVFTFYLSEPIMQSMGQNAHYVAVAISSLFLSLMLMMEHKNIAPKIIGFLSMENTLFLLGVTATGGMPMLIELGIFFDLLMAIVIVTLLLNRKEI